MFPAGLLIMFSAWGKQFLWTTAIFLGLQAAITLILLYNLAEFKSVTSAAILLFIVSFFIELMGLNTGFPFGRYRYTDVLIPSLYGVPVSISFAWFTLSVNSLLVSKYFLRSGAFTIAVISSVFILAADIMLEPFAAFVNNYWIWTNGSIPIQNFISWLIIGFLFSFLANGSIKWSADFHQKKRLLKIPFLIMGLNVLNYTLVNAVNGYYIITTSGLLIFAIVLSSLFRFKANES
jgi:putative membrane protein